MINERGEVIKNAVTTVTNAISEKEKGVRLKKKVLTKRKKIQTQITTKVAQNEEERTGSVVDMTLEQPFIPCIVYQKKKTFIT